METAQRHWIGRNEALDRLGVKTQTLYAYVSRGRITARPDPENPRRSLYAADDVARLCDGTPAPAAPAVIGASAVRGEASASHPSIDAVSASAQARSASQGGPTLIRGTRTGAGVGPGT